MVCELRFDPGSLRPEAVELISAVLGEDFDGFRAVCEGPSGPCRVEAGGSWVRRVEARGWSDYWDDAAPGVHTPIYTSKYHPGCGAITRVYLRADGAVVFSHDEMGGEGVHVVVPEPTRAVDLSSVFDRLDKDFAADLEKVPHAYRTVPPEAVEAARTARFYGADAPAAENVVRGAEKPVLALIFGEYGEADRLADLLEAAGASPLLVPEEYCEARVAADLLAEELAAREYRSIVAVGPAGCVAEAERALRSLANPVEIPPEEREVLESEALRIAMLASYNDYDCAEAAVEGGDCYFIVSTKPPSDPRAWRRARLKLGVSEPGALRGLRA